MINNFNEFEKVVQKLIADLAEFKPRQVVWDRQNAPRPIKPYIALYHFAYHRVGFDETEQNTDIDGKLTIDGQYQLTLQVSYFGDNAIETLQTIERKLWFPSVADRCALEGLAVYDTSEVSDLTMTLNNKTQYEERANLDVMLRIGLSDIDKTSWIEQINLKQLRM